MPQAPTHQRLYVLRHAKSSWADPYLDDHDRPLAPRGRKATELLSRYLAAEDIRPVVILCSTARRARETLEAAGPSGEVLIEPELYGASAGGLIERLRRVPRGTSSAMLIGHNPALHVLISTLAPSQAATRAPGDDPRLDAVYEKFPTGALATLTFTCAWSRLGPGRAELSAVIRPRDLAERGS